ncbi:MAG TPA: GNAT family N-acetyltransferase, partial [Acidimicrobiales bacterium]|nr:GNAT family N-acetyltransferase [Acidimicrobiales bacterium]
MSCEVRPAEPGEAGALARLNLRTALAAYGHIFPPEAPPPTPEELQARWEHWLGPDHAHGRRAFVAVVDGDQAGAGEVVGTVLAGPDPDDPQVGHLARLNVDPDRWGQGIGTRLYDVAMASMVDAGFPAATLWVLEANAKARSWYERLGWRLSGTRKPMYAPAGIDDVGYR